MQLAEIAQIDGRIGLMNFMTKQDDRSVCGLDLSLGIVGNLKLMRDEEAQRLANQNLVPVMFGRGRNGNGHCGTDVREAYLVSLAAPWWGR